MATPKVYGHEVPNQDYSLKSLNDIIATGLTFGITSHAQPEAKTFTSGDRGNFEWGPVSEIVAALNATGLTAEFIQITWNEVSEEDPFTGEVFFTITDLRVGYVVTAQRAIIGYDLLTALRTLPWYEPVVDACIPVDAYTEYLLSPCPSGYHWDSASGTCVHDNCPSGYHWDTDTQTCVIDTPTNCPIGTHWDTTQGKCVSDQAQTNGKSFPWTPVLIGLGAISIIGLGGYYLYRRSKRRKPPSLPMQNALNQP